MGIVPSIVLEPVVAAARIPTASSVRSGLMHGTRGYALALFRFRRLVNAEENEEYTRKRLEGKNVRTIFRLQF